MLTLNNLKSNIKMNKRKLTPGEFFSFYGYEPYDKYESISKQKETFGFNDDSEIINGVGMIDGEGEPSKPEVYGEYSGNRIQKEALGINDDFEIVEGKGVVYKTPPPITHPSPAISDAYFQITVAYWKILGLCIFM